MQQILYLAINWLQTRSCKQHYSKREISVKDYCKFSYDIIRTLYLVLEVLKLWHNYKRSLGFDRYSLTTMAQDTPCYPFSIIQGCRSIYKGVKPFTPYNFPLQPGSAPQVSHGLHKKNKPLVPSQREFQINSTFHVHN